MDDVCIHRDSAHNWSDCVIHNCIRKRPLKTKTDLFCCSWEWIGVAGKLVAPLQRGNSSAKVESLSSPVIGGGRENRSDVTPDGSVFPCSSSREIVIIHAALPYGPIRNHIVKFWWNLVATGVRSTGTATPETRISGEKWGKSVLGLWAMVFFPWMEAFPAPKHSVWHYWTAGTFQCSR